MRLGGRTRPGLLLSPEPLSTEDETEPTAHQVLGRLWPFKMTPLPFAVLILSQGVFRKQNAPGPLEVSRGHHSPGPGRRCLKCGLSLVCFGMVARFSSPPVDPALASSAQAVPSAPRPPPAINTETTEPPPLRTGLYPLPGSISYASHVKATGHLHVTH